MKILFINQNYWPDMSASAQYLTDLVEHLSRNGHVVQVLASRRAYFDAGTLYNKDDIRNNVIIKRVRVPNFKKIYGAKRILQAVVHNVSFLFAYLFSSKHDLVVVLTSPPLIHWAIALGNIFKGANIIHWSLDINPEQTLQTGWVKKEGPLAKVLKYINRYALLQYTRVIVLDEYMRETVIRAGLPDSRVAICPLWYNEEDTKSISHRDNSIRKKLGSNDKYVVLYAGNHSICHPLDTLLRVASELKEERDIQFAFIGGGARFSQIKRHRDEHGLKNIEILPYQKRTLLPEILSAADLHVVPVGEDYVGLVHPSKIYGVLGIRRPLLCIGPENCSVENLIRDTELAERFSHGEVQQIKDFILANKDKKEQMREAIHSEYASQNMLPKLASLLTT